MANDFQGFAYHVVYRYGNSINVPPLREGEAGYDIDKKVARVGDGTSTPPRIITDKSFGAFEYDQVEYVKYREVQLFEGGKIDGLDPSSLITATGFAFHSQDGQFTNVRFVSANMSIKFGGLQPQEGGGATFNIELSDELMAVLIGGFNLANVETVTVLPTELENAPVVRFAGQIFIWNKNTGRFENTGIPVYTDPIQVPTSPGPHVFVDATDAGNHRMMTWNGAAYEYVGGGSRVHVGAEEPDAPAEGMFWKDTDDFVTKLRLDNQWEELETASAVSPTALARTTLWESWRYNDEGYVWEMFVPHRRFNQRQFASVPVQTVANDDTMTVANSNLFTVGATYVVYTATQVIGEVTILNKPTLNTIRITDTFGTTLDVNAGAFIGPSSFALNADATATVEGYDVYYTTGNDILHDWENAYLVIRREANGKGSFRAYYRETGTDMWIEAEMIKSQGVQHDPFWSEHFYSIRLNRKKFDTKITFSGADGVEEKIKHIVWFTDPEQLAEFRIEKPTNVSPADQETSVGQTPTLTLSAYSSFYNLDQGGAQFQISRDSRFFDLVLDTSSEPLVSWAATAGQSAAFTDVLMYTVGDNKRRGLLVADGGVIRATDDGAKTFANGTSAHTTKDIKAVAYNGIDTFFAAGVDGTVQYSTNRTAWTASASVDGFTDDIFGIAAYGNNVIAVGENGKILISVNKGVSFTSAVTAASYTGTWAKVCMDSTGRAIAVGANGAIHTSPDFGVTWQARTPAGSYAGAFKDVAMSNGYAIAVGASGEVQTSSDFGATWTHRTPANSYASQINGVDILGMDAIFVGANGEIQTSKNRGQTWVKRPQNGAVSTAWGAAALNADRYAFIAGASGGIQHSFVLEGVAGNTYAVPSGTDLLQNNSVYFWRGRFQDEKGYWSEWSDRTAFVTSATFRYVGQPANLLPANNATSITTIPNLVTTAFTSVGMSDTHSKTQYQIATSADFTTPLYDSGDSNDLVSHTAAVTLSSFTTYYWRARHKGAVVGYGAWSVPTMFSTQAVPNAPTITQPQNNSTNQSLTPILKTSVFVNSDPNVTHSATQFQIATDSGFSNIIYDSGSVTTDPLQHQVPTAELTPFTVYYVRARHKGATTSWSNYSATVAFTTIAISVSTPAITASAIGPNSVTLTTSAFGVSGGVDTHQSSDWEIRTGANGGGSIVASSINNTTNKTSITLGDLAPSTTYYFRARHKGTTYGNSDWGYGNADSQFTTTPAVGEALFVAPGIYSFVVPAGVTTISCVAVGGGGSAIQGGGGGGGLRFNTFSVTPGSTIFVTVGGGGVGTNHGGTSSVGTFITAYGGRGGTFPTLWDLIVDPFGVGRGGLGGSGVGGLGGDGGRGSSNGFFNLVNGGGGGAGGYWGPGGEGAGVNNFFFPGPSNEGRGGAGGGGSGRNGGGTGLHGTGPSGRGSRENNRWGYSRWNDNIQGAHGSPSYAIVEFTSNINNSPNLRADNGQTAFTQTPRNFKNDRSPHDFKMAPGSTIQPGQIFRGFKPASYVLGPKERAYPVGWGGGGSAGDGSLVSQGAVRLIWGQGRSYPEFTDGQTQAYNYAGEA